MMDIPKLSNPPRPRLSADSSTPCVCSTILTTPLRLNTSCDHFCVETTKPTVARTCGIHARVVTSPLGRTERGDVASTIELASNNKYCWLPTGISCLRVKHDVGGNVQRANVAYLPHCAVLVYEGYTRLS